MGLEELSPYYPHIGDNAEPVPDHYLVTKPNINQMDVTSIARVCHEANKGLCEANNDFTQKTWDEADQWQRDSAIKGVEFAVANPGAPASAQHDAWSSDKVADGWKWGETKDAEAKTHPCLVPFEELPEFQQKKDILFKAVVNALK